jgi:hypothetical protein
MTKSRKSSKKNSGKWIKGAIKKPGSLRKYAKENYPGTGKKGAFTEKGTLKMSWINKMLKKKDLSPLLKRRLVLARTLKKMVKSGSRKRSFGKRRRSRKSSRRRSTKKSKRRRRRIRFSTKKSKGCGCGDSCGCGKNCKCGSSCSCNKKRKFG